MSRGTGYLLRNPFHIHILEQSKDNGVLRIAAGEFQTWSILYMNMYCAEPSSGSYIKKMRGTKQGYLRATVAPFHSLWGLCCSCFFLWERIGRRRKMLPFLRLSSIVIHLWLEIFEARDQVYTEIWSSKFIFFSLLGNVYALKMILITMIYVTDC